MKTIELEVKKNESGSLVPFYPQEKDFDIKRMFVIKDVPIDMERGNHAHRKENQYIICIRGIIVVYSDDGNYVEKTTLEENECAYLPALTWNTFSFLEEGTSMLVLGSEDFDEDEYIRDYSEFKQITDREII